MSPYIPWTKGNNPSVYTDEERRGFLGARTLYRIDPIVLTCDHQGSSGCIMCDVPGAGLCTAAMMQDNSDGYSGRNIFRVRQNPAKIDCFFSHRGIGTGRFRGLAMTSSEVFWRFLATPFCRCTKCIHKFVCGMISLIIARVCAREEKDFENMIYCYYGDLRDAPEVPQTRCMMQYDPSFIIHEINRWLENVDSRDSGEMDQHKSKITASQSSVFPDKTKGQGVLRDI
ncbi:hypothetical protein EDD85DRAFT_789605 [Armillaria nabsnona]|nr:hypothetical protein EDD85DRAFT_789605 [Armillaria nabsnona]